MAEAANSGTPALAKLAGHLRGARARRIALWFAGFLIAFGLFGYFVGPPLAKSLLLKQLSKELGRDVAVASIDINPYALSARVTGVSISAEGGREVAGFDELFVNLSSFSLFQMGVVVDEIRLAGPRVAVARLAEGRYDISDLLDKWLQPSEPSPTPRFSLNNIEVTGGKLVFDDKPEGRVHRVEGLELKLPFISSLPYQAEIVVQPSFSATVDGAPLVLQGKSKEIFAGQLESELAVDLDRLDLAALQPYVPDWVPLRVAGGRLDTELKIVFKEVTDKTFSLVVNGAAHVSDLVLSESGGAHLVGWKRLDVEIGEADIVNNRFLVRSVAVDGLDAAVSVSRVGELSLMRLSERLLAGLPAADPKVAPAKPVEWAVEGIKLSNGRVRWKDESTVRTVEGDLLDLNVAIGRIDHRLAEPVEIAELAYRMDLGERFRTRDSTVKGLRIDVHGHRVEVDEAVSRGIRASLVRNKEGQVEWLSMPLLKTARKVGKELSDERPWNAVIGRLSVVDAAVRVEDRSTSPVAVQTIDGFELTAEKISTEANAKGTLAVKAKVNGKGALGVDGNVQLNPVATALQVETTALPLLPLQPYFTDFLNIQLNRGIVSNKGEVRLQIDKGNLAGGYKGSLTVGDLLAVDKANSADFLKWRSLHIGGIDVALQPMKVDIAEVALSDFYSRLILNKDGRLNLQDIVRRAEPTAVGSADATPAAKPAEKPVENPTGKAAGASPLPLRIAKVTLQGGTVNFSDYFVKPNYTVNVNKVAGRVSGLSSAADTLADLELRGSYANSAPVQVVARLNPLAAESFLDLKADVSGVDLVPFSPYSGKYAGYNIEKGKLSLNVAYKLENRKLSAENKVFIDQLTFGEKVDSPDATSLPVNLAIALLKNNRGEIDINLPISGSLDDPEFSVGGLIVRVIVNLFVKAVSSPFALLGSMFGGGEELSSIEFPPGYASIDAASLKRLEAIAKALLERETLKLEITGRADPESDREGLKRAAMERAVKSEKLKDLVKKGGEGVSLDSVEVAPDEYPAYLKRAYGAAKFPKPRNLVGLQKDLPVEEMEKLMLANAVAGDDEVRELALRRAETVQAWLLEQGKVPAARVFLLPPKVGPDDKGRATRADFSLR
ncbi:MAG: DUF748 domain-containing protein [Betaproteobacteria bacterium]|nr:DUF748 domain-containing protein [Betaproteobacteria bacterium]